MKQLPTTYNFYIIVHMPYDKRNDVIWTAESEEVIAIWILKVLCQYIEKYVTDRIYLTLHREVILRKLILPWSFIGGDKLNRVKYENDIVLLTEKKSARTPR